MQHRQLLAGFGLAAALNVVSLSPALTATDNYLIIPGQSVGQTHLGTNGLSDLEKLPTPAASDAAMQQTKRVWVVKQGQRTDTLYIHTTVNAAVQVQPLDGVTIDQIEITSPSFHTPSGISTKSTKAQVLRQLPNARPLAGSTTKYSDKGIAFEFAGSSAESPCVSIAVSPNDKVGIKGREQVNSFLQSNCLAGEGKC